MSLTPTIRDFLVQLDDLLDRNAPAALDRDTMKVTTGDAAALVLLPHAPTTSATSRSRSTTAGSIVGYRPSG